MKEKEEDEEEEIFFAKILKMTKYTSLPNLVRLAQWEQVSEYYYYVQPGLLRFTLFVLGYVVFY